MRKKTAIKLLDRITNHNRTTFIINKDKSYTLSVSLNINISDGKEIKALKELFR